MTGASSGIGAEFARQLAERGHDLVLVSREAVRLDGLAVELGERYGVAVEVIAADLLDPNGLARVEERITVSDRPIEVLVNNAGFGLRNDFDLNPIEDELRLLELLVTVPMRLAHRALQHMIVRRSGTIINVSSIAAYAPLTTYSAAKAWLHTFSRWANAYYRPAGITVTALAPGFVRTEFHARMGVTRESMAPAWMWLDVEPLVRTALLAADRGRAVSIPSLKYRFISVAARALPMGFVTRSARKGRWAKQG